MSTAKDELKKILESQPDDSTTEEILRELTFHVMVQRGSGESDAGRMVPIDEIGRRIQSWAQ